MYLLSLEINAQPCPECVTLWFHHVLSVSQLRRLHPAALCERPLVALTVNCTPVFYHFLWWNILDQRRFEGASKQQRQRKLASLRAADLNSVCVVCVCVRERETAVCVCVTAVCLYETETAAKWVPTLSVFTTTRFLIVCSYRWYTVSVPWWVSNWTKTTDLFGGFFSLKGLKSLAFLMPVLLERIWMSRLS